MVALLRADLASAYVTGLHRELNWASRCIYAVDAPTACCGSFVGSTRCDDQILPWSHDLWGQHLPTRLWQSLLLNDWCKHGKGWPRSWSPSSLLTACLLLAADFRTISCQFAANFVWDIGTTLRIKDAILREKLRDQCSHLFCCWFCTFLHFFQSFLRLKLRLGGFSCFRHASSTQNGRL